MRTRDRIVSPTSTFRWPRQISGIRGIAWAHPFERRPRPAVDGRAADAEPARRDDAWHDGLERARARDRALRAACGRGPRDDRHHCRALLRGPCAREPVLRPNRRSLRAQTAPPGGAALGCRIVVPLFARDDASVARPGASEPRPRERTRRAEFDGPHGGHLHEGWG